MQKDKIEDLILPLLESLGYELVDVNVAGEKVLIYIDKEGGIKMDDCVKASRHVSDLMESDPDLAGRFGLEISSPGAERPLKNVKDFIRFQGSLVKVKFKDPATDKNKSIIGDLVSVSDSFIKVKVNGCSLEKVFLADIVKANLRI